MRKLFLLLLIILSLFSGNLLGNQNSKGFLVIIGGGNKPDYLLKEMINLAGGMDAKFAIIPMASSVPMESAKNQKEDLERLGVKNLEIIICDSLEANSD